MAIKTLARRGLALISPDSRRIRSVTEHLKQVDGLPDVDFIHRHFGQKSLPTTFLSKMMD
jgi:hypothetical protein